MVFLNYRGRIHRGKFTARSVRYILSDQAARFFPSLQQRWLLPVASQPIADAAREIIALPSAAVDVPIPDCFVKLGISYPAPLQQVHRVHMLDGVFMTGWAGAMIKDGLFLAVRPKPNWVSSLRARPHRIRNLSDGRVYFNLMTPIPARSHMFHWLYDSILPLISLMESGRAPTGLGLVVNARLSEIQARSIAFLKARYAITEVEPVEESEAVFVPHAAAAIADHSLPRGLQSPLGLARLNELGQFIAGDAGQEDWPKRIYVSRNDARLRRVLNEEAIMPGLEARGYKRVSLAAMPISRQVGLFLNAEAAIGPHGAAFAHISWCKPGTKITEFIPSPDSRRRTTRPLANADFWFIALQRNLRYSCYIAGGVQRSDAFTIPLELLTEAVDI